MMKTKQIFSISATAEDLVPDKFGRMNYFIAILIALLMSALITILLSRLPTVVPLFFSLPWGEARLAPKLFLFTLPAIIFLLIIINLIFGRIAQKLSPLLPKVLAVATTVVAIMLLVALLGIIQSLVL